MSPTKQRARKFLVVPVFMKPTTSAFLLLAPLQGRHWRVTRHPSLTPVLLLEPMSGITIDPSSETLKNRLALSLIRIYNHHVPITSSKNELRFAEKANCLWRLFWSELNCIFNTIYKISSVFIMHKPKNTWHSLKWRFKIFLNKTKSFLNVLVHMFLRS